MAVIEEHEGAGPPDYAVEAEREATEAGMGLDELHSVLKGATITAVIPPCNLEPLADYGLRATGEILVRYLMDE